MSKEQRKRVYEYLIALLFPLLLALVGLTASILDRLGLLP